MKIKATNQLFSINFKVVLFNGTVPPQTVKVRRVWADTLQEAELSLTQAGRRIIVKEG